MKYYIIIQYGFGDILENTVGGGLGGAVSTGMGLLFGPAMANQQQQNQQVLLNQQEQANEKLSAYNFQQQFDFWNKTNYPAQVEQLQKAGLNPALLYAKGGPGGSTGSPSGGAGMGIAPGASANDVAKTMQNSQALGLEQQLLEAQKENIEADTKQKLADAQKKSGVDTANVQANTELTQQQLDNARQAFDNQQLQNTMQNILNYEQQASQKDRLEYITQQAKQAIEQTGLIANQRKISDATKNDQIKIIQQDAIGSVLKNELTKANINLNEQQIKQSVNQIMINWDTLNNETMKTTLDNTLKQLQISNTGNASQETYDNILKAIQAIKGTPAMPLNISK